MTESSAQAPDQERTGLRRRIAGMRAVGFVVLFAERLLVAALPALGIAALFLILGWFGVWRMMPGLLKAAVTAALLAGLIASLLRFKGFRLPDRSTIDRRLEGRSGLSHQAISVQTEQPVGSDLFSKALWKRHQTRMAQTIKAIDAGFPAPDIARRDPYALRAITVLALVIAWTFSLSNYGGRVRDAFDYSASTNLAADQRIDAWVTPPSYTGVAPVYLSGAQAKPAEGPVRVPQMSELTIRISGSGVTDDVTFTSASGAQPVVLTPEKAGSQAQADAAREALESRTYKFKLARDGKVSVNGRDYAFAVTPDTPPKIAFAKEPSRALNGALEIAFEIKDDYGVAEAYAEIRPVDSEPGAIPLFAPPEFRLDLPGGDAKHVKGTTSRDLTEHPLSGKKVLLTLVARDAAGLGGRSETREIVLPARFFSEPLAGSVAEQRQVFSLDINKIQRALDLNEAATFRPEETIPNLRHYLLTQSAKNRLKFVSSIAGLEEVSTYFWDVARYIEDGDLSSAEKRLRNAQDKLSEALARNASDAEIQKLMDELRQAMKDYLSEMAKRMQNPDNTQMSRQAQRMMRTQDFDNMLNQLENLARSGSRDEARKLLSEMQRMLNNMQTARPSDGNQQQNPMREQIDKLGELMQKQQQLMEDTHRTEQALRERMQREDLSEDGDQSLTEPPAGNPEDSQDQSEQQSSPEDKMTAEQLRQALKEMKERQQQLQKDLGALQKKLSELGLKPMPGFGDAGKEMGESSEALGKSQGQRSADAQGRALDALRKGAGDLMQQLQQAGQNGQPGMPMQSGQQSEGNDPLGRRSGQLGSENDDQVKVPDQIDVQRAREILDQIRRKLGDGPASLIEKEYLERLLDLR
ncbi:TIGR02302 family protein [Rhizobium sp. KVB221]|uniref:TIGR02302 family protein n=1 Tax=Rhizobium setariae TaxID=2801340 RepID=A0A936YS45_9HYPH|nr:TIGR02302 family protein [Rhizobium setariae]MBL0374718.1 TIGR02302 family protein [Rhizobium setariae]